VISLTHKYKTDS